jgi:hypothetical protein
MFAFVCSKQEDDAWPDEEHETSTAMRKCNRCNRYAVAGYICETCGHEDTDPSDQLAGHGPDKCHLIDADQPDTTTATSSSDGVA